MPDVAIVNATVTPVPDDYSPAGTASVLVKAVRAAVDGTGAAGSYLPALQLLDGAGHVMWTAVDTSAPIAAGGSADVSWFPGLGGGGGAAGSTSAWAFGQRTTNYTVGAGGSGSVPFTHAVTSDSTILEWTTSSAANDQVTVHQPGIVIFSVNTVWAAPANYGRSVQANTGLFSSQGLGFSPETDANTAATDTGTPRAVGDLAICVTQSVPQTLNCFVKNFDGVAHAVTQAFMVVQYVSNSTLVS